MRHRTFIFYSEVDSVRFMCYAETVTPLHFAQFFGAGAALSETGKSTRCINVQMGSEREKVRAIFLLDNVC